MEVYKSAWMQYIVYGNRITASVITKCNTKGHFDTRDLFDFSYQNHRSILSFLFWAPFSSRLLAWLEVAAKSGFPVRACPLCGDEKRHARVCWLGWPQLLFPACRVVKVTAAGAICASAGLRSCAEALSCFPPDAIWAPEYCITRLAAGCSARHFMERQIARALNSDELSSFLPCRQQRRCREA